MSPDGQERPDRRTQPIDPEVTDVHGNERWTERAGRIHRGALDRERDEPAQGDRATHGKSGVGADDLVAVCRAEDHRDQEPGEHRLDGEGHAGINVRRRDPGVGGRAEQAVQDDRGRQGTGQLRPPVAGQPRRWQQATHGEGQRDGRIEVGPGYVTEGVDHRHHEERRCDGPRGGADLATTQ